MLKNSLSSVIWGNISGIAEYFLSDYAESFTQPGMNSSKPILIELQYLPPLEYFVLLNGRNTVLLDAHEHFEKQTYRNRCYIKGPHQVEKLTVPVKGSGKKLTTSEIEIDYRQKWLQQHWRTLEAAYGKAPFFEHYAPFFQGVYEKKPRRLWELNLEMLTLCLKFLQIPVTLQLTGTYLESTNPAVLDWRTVINPKKGAIASNIYQPKPYNQIFGKDFVGDLSVVDLLFCEGPAAKLILQNSAKA